MKEFNIDNYYELYKQTEITVLAAHRPRLLAGSRGRAQTWSSSADIPSYVFLFRDEIIPELYDNPMLGVEGCNLTQLVASAYKEMFYQHFQRGEVWKGRALECALSMMFMSITAQSIYDKCNATHWIFKVGPHSIAGGSMELYTAIGAVVVKDSLRATVTGSRFIKGDTPTNGKQSSTVAISELTVNSNFIWTERGNSGNQHPLNRLVLSVATPFTEQHIPTFGEIVLANADKIRQFVGE